MTSGGGGIVDVIVNRPPVTVFLLCLVAFAVATLSLSLYVGTSDHLPDPDTVGWNVLLSELSELRYCLEPGTDPDETPIERGANLSVLLPVTATFGRTLVREEGQNPKEIETWVRSRVKMSDLSRRIPAKYKHLQLQMLFRLPSDDSTDNGEGDTSCMEIEASPDLDRDLISGFRPANCSWKVGANPHRLVIPLSSHSGHSWPEGWCQNGTPIDLAFADRPLWTTYISRDDQAMVRVHLMATSAFLFALVGLLMLVAFLRGLWTGKSRSDRGRKDADPRRSESPELT